MKFIKSLLLKTLPVSAVTKLRALDYRLHSPEERLLLSRLCDRAKCSVDVGANLGILTHYLARYSRHVYAYEPNPQLASQLRRAFDSRVTVLEAALSDTSGSTVLKMPYYRGVEMHGLASIAQDFKDADYVKEFTVPVRRLDDEGLNDVGFLKIDVEQNEEKVLRGAMTFICRQRPNMLLEVTPKLYSRSLLEFLGDFLALGYRGYFLYDRQLLKIEDYRPEVHNHSDNYGVRGKYMTNVVLSNSPLGAL
jgi:FkbM family methyltransferase